jgi:hypothetical protein
MVGQVRARGQKDAYKSEWNDTDWRLTGEALDYRGMADNSHIETCSLVMEGRGLISMRFCGIFKLSFRCDTPPLGAFRVSEVVLLYRINLI